MPSLSAPFTLQSRRLPPLLPALSMGLEASGSAAAQPVAPGGTILASAAATEPSHTHPLTLAQTEQLLLIADPDVRAAQRALIGARADIECALARPNPQVDTDLFNSDPSSFGHRSQSQRILIDRLIERGNKRALRGDVATGATKAARVDMVDTVRQQRLSVHLAYWELASAQARRETALGTVELLRRLSDAVERRVAAGDLARVDLARLQWERNLQ